MVDASSRSSSPTSLDPDIRMDLEQQLEMNLEQITCRYASYVHYILNSVQTKGVSVTDLRSYLLNITAFQSGCKEQCKLLSAVKTELDEADTINKIFDLLSCKCASFFNFKVFQFLVDEYDIRESGDRVRLNYPQLLEAYINKHKISEFVAINPALEEHNDGSATLVFKFNIELTCKVATISNLKAAVAKILDLKPSTLRLLSIEKGCVVVTFLIPTEVADIIFVHGKKFTAVEVEEFRSLSVVWLECNGCKFDFFKRDAQVNAGKVYS